MTSIPPTARICEAIREFLTKGISDSNDVTNTLFFWVLKQPDSGAFRAGSDRLPRPGTL